MSDFSDRPFVAGHLVGLRAFRVDQLARLIAVNYSTVWRPGENVAECLRGRTVSWAISRAFSPLIHFNFDGTLESSKSEEPKPKHDPLSLTCTCGFYAYFDGKNDYKTSGLGDGRVDKRVAGVIKGYGRVVVGTRGFRAEKAEIVALVLKDYDDPRKASIAAKIRHNYGAIPVFPSRAAALAEFPLTEPEPVTPETCDDFWTRSV